MKHIERQSTKYYLARKRVMQVLDLSEGQYFNLQFENAYAYLAKSERYADWEFTKDIVNCKLFWSWWKNQYSIFDSRFLHEFDSNNSLYSQSTIHLLEYYSTLQIEKDVYPHSSLLETMLKEIDARTQANKQPESTKTPVQ